MNFHPPLKLCLLVAATLWLPVQAADQLSSAELKSSKAQIDASYAKDKAACGALRANALDVCREEAKARERIAQAELDHRNSGSAADAHKIRTVKAEAAYAVAREKCDDWSGNAKDVCIKEAKAVEVKAMADAKLSQTVADAKRDASDDKHKAEYKVAAEKCESLSGEPKSACIANAKSLHGQ